MRRGASYRNHLPRRGEHQGRRHQPDCDLACDALALPNASFEASDFLSVSFAGYDVIATIECLYYLSPTEQEKFFSKLASEHAGKVFILSGPIIGSNEYRTYFTDRGVTETFARHGLSLIEGRNLNAYRKAGVGATIAAALCRLPLGSAVWTFCPRATFTSAAMSLGVPLPNSWASLTAPPASHAGGQAADPGLASGLPRVGQRPLRFRRGMALPRC
jgi:hypothetical protein